MTVSNSALTTLAPLAGSSLGKKALLAFGGSLFLAALSQITVPMLPVPMTLQTLAVMLIGLTFGGRMAAATVALYLVEGAAGFPVFAGFAGGAQHLVGPTAGYLFGFLGAAALIGFAADKGLTKSWMGTVGLLLAGEVLLFGLGYVWLGYNIGFEKAWAFGVVPFLIGDAIKVALAALIGKGVLKGAAQFAKL